MFWHGFLPLKNPLVCANMKRETTVCKNCKLNMLQVSGNVFESSVFCSWLWHNSLTPISSALNYFFSFFCTCSPLTGTTVYFTTDKMVLYNSIYIYLFIYFWHQILDPWVTFWHRATCKKSPTAAASVQWQRPSTTTPNTLTIPATVNAENSPVQKIPNTLMNRTGHHHYMSEPRPNFLACGPLTYGSTQLSMAYILTRIKLSEISETHKVSVWKNTPSVFTCILMWKLYLKLQMTSS